MYLHTLIQILAQDLDGWRSLREAFVQQSTELAEEKREDFLREGLLNQREKGYPYFKIAVESLGEGLGPAMDVLMLRQL